jgi:DNA mismatch endonuclease (patch repair protein)
MADLLTPDERSERMRRIQSRDTSPEFVVRAQLHRMGLRFSLRTHSLPGRPDLILPKWRVAVFIHGCFWHGHHHCGIAHIPRTHTNYWANKIRANRLRDARKRRQLLDLGWRVLQVWECHITKDPLGTATQLYERITGCRPRVAITFSRRDILLAARLKVTHKLEGQKRNNASWLAR